MRNRSLLIIIVTTFLIGYAQEWFPYIWSHVQPTNKVTFLGKLKKAQTSKCGDEFENLECRETLKVSKENLYNSSGEIKSILGLGFFLTDFSVICDNTEVFRSFSGEGYSLSFDSFKVYKTINLKALNCKPNSDIYINAYTAPGLKTYGQISTNALVGTTEFINSAKRAIEFLSTGIYLICSIILLFSWGTKFVVLKDFRSQYTSKYVLSGEYYLAPLWATFALFKSGLLDILTSTPTSVQVLFRTQSFVSLVIHTTPILIFMFSDRKTIRNILLCLVIVYIPFFAFTNLFNDFLVYTAQTFSVIGLIFFIFLKPNRIGAIFSSLVLIETLKVFNRSFLPPGSVTLLFMTTLYFRSCLGFLGTAGTFASANLWFRQFSKDVKDQDELEDIFGSISLKMKTKRISVFLLGNDDNHTLLTYDNKKLSTTYINSVPGPFAQVISTGSEILHAKASSVFGKNLFKRSPDMVFGDHFSIYPLRRSGRIAGIIAISKYDNAIHSSSLLRLRVDAFLKVFAQTISLATQSINRHAKENLLGKIQKATANTKTLQSSNNFESFSNHFLREIEQTCGWQGFVGKLRDKNLEIIASSYHRENGGDFLTGQSWEMLEENVRAPAPVALHYGKTVYVPNVSWLNENISKNTKILFEQTEMKSFVAIPILDHKKEGNKAFALLWLSTRNIGGFDTSFENCAHYLQETFEGEHNRLVNVNIGRTVFSDIIREDIRNQLLAGQNPFENEEGTLIMADLVGSTAFSKFLGHDGWKLYQEDFIRECRTLGDEIGLVSEVFVWDALYMTSKRVLTEKELIELTTKIQNKIISLNNKHKTNHLISNSKKCVRVCATFGDTSKAVSNGAWAITGHAMARVCKLEQEIKKKEILLAISADLTSKWGDIVILEKDLDVLTLSDAVASPDYISTYPDRKDVA